MDNIEKQLQEIYNWAENHKNAPESERFHYYEIAKEQVGNLVGWHGQFPNDKAYNVAMNTIREMLWI